MYRYVELLVLTYLEAILCAPQDVHILILGTCECHLMWHKRLCRWDSIKDAEMEKLSCISLVDGYNHGVSCMRDEESLREKERVPS